MNCAVVQILPADSGILLLYLSSLLLLLEQAMLAPTVEKLSIFLAKYEAMAVFAIVFLDCFVLELKPYYLSFLLSIFPCLSCFPSGFYPS